MIAEAFKRHWCFKLCDGCLTDENKSRCVRGVAGHEFLAKLFQSLANIYSVSDDRVIDATGRADVANSNSAAVDTDPQVHRLVT